MHDLPSGLEIRRPSNMSPGLAAAWDEVAPQVLPTIGAAGLEALATVVLRLRDARRRIDDDGVLVAGDRGQPGAHPALAIERDAIAEIRAWMSAFGR